MDIVAIEVAQYLSERLKHIPADARLLVGISGIPASGKSTLAALIVERYNASGASETPGAVLVGLDGWHLTRAQLDAFPDPQLAHDRRGIHWTFDAPAYLAFVKSLREPFSSSSSAITAPSFDHAVKDPTPHAVSILPEHRLVVIEGLYTFLSVAPWSEAGMLLDERWWVELDEQEAKRRLVKRHVISGVAKDVEEAHWRADENDMPNGRFILANMLEPTRILAGVDDPAFSLGAV